MDPNITTDQTPALLQRLMQVDAEIEALTKYVLGAKCVLRVAEIELHAAVEARRRVSREIHKTSPELDGSLPGKAPACPVERPTRLDRLNDELLAGVREAEARKFQGAGERRVVFSCDRCEYVRTMLDGGCPRCGGGSCTRKEVPGSVYRDICEAEAQRPKEPAEIPSGQLWSIRVCNCCGLRRPSHFFECPRCACSSYTLDGVLHETYQSICKLIDDARQAKASTDSNFWGDPRFWAEDCG